MLARGMKKISGPKWARRAGRGGGGRGGGSRVPKPRRRPTRGDRHVAHVRLGLHLITCGHLLYLGILLHLDHGQRRL